MIMFGSFLPSLLVGFSTTNFTRASEPTLSWNQLHSKSRRRSTPLCVGGRTDGANLRFRSTDFAIPTNTAVKMERHWGGLLWLPLRNDGDRFVCRIGTDKCCPWSEGREQDQALRRGTGG